MIPLGLRLAVAGGREAVLRLVIIAAAVALGAGLLLTTLAGLNGVNSQNARYAWLNTNFGAPAPVKPGVSPTWWQGREDYFDGRLVARIDVAATGPDSPVPPGIPRLPGPGEFYASPEMTKLFASVPAGQFADRYPGHQIGTVGDAALPSPKSLIIIVGRTPAEMANLPTAGKVTSIASTAPGDCDDCVIGIRTAGMDLVLAVVAGALLFPLLIFVGAATRLNAARREQRFAAMRLVGATPRQVSVIAAVEATGAAAAGTLVGFVLFFIFRDPVAGVPFTGSPFFASDLSLNLADVLLIALGVPLGAAVAAWLALRRVRISPLGVTRRVTPRPPRAYRLIPVLAGIAELSVFVFHQPGDLNAQVAAYLSGFLVIMAGLVIAGPWLTMVGSRLLARRSRRPATLMAARRLADNPQAAFRAISGLVLGLFCTSVAIGVITAINADRGGQPTGPAATALVVNLRALDIGQVPDLPAGTAAELRAIPGVRGLVAVRESPESPGGGGPRGGPPPAGPGLISCADLAAVPSLGRCPAGATVAEVSADLIPPWQGSGGAGVVWPAASLTPDRLQALPMMSVVAETDGSTAAIERARTILEATYPRSPNPPATQRDRFSDTTKSLTGWRQLASVVVVASLAIAGCSLAVSVAGGLTERKRAFSLLRLTGAPLRMLRRMVVLESAVPLFAVAVVAIGVGFLAAHLFLKAQMHLSLVPPDSGYYVVVGAGLAASFAIIGSTLPLLRRITGPEAARND